MSYQVDLTVDDHGTKHVGTGVWRSTIRGTQLFGYNGVFEGEAIPIDLGSKGTVYALIVGRSPDGNPEAGGSLDIYGRHLFGEVARSVRGEPIKHLNPMEEYEEFASKIGQRAALDCAHPPTRWTTCPFLVRFRNENDPPTVEAVDPSDLAATYGAGVSLEPIVITLSERPVTEGLEKRLPWLPSLKGSIVKKRFNSRGNRTLVNMLTEADFSYFQQ